MTHKYEAIYHPSFVFKSEEEWIEKAYEFYGTLRALKEAAVKWVSVQIGICNHHYITTNDGEVYEFRFDEVSKRPLDIRYLGLGKTD